MKKEERKSLIAELIGRIEFEKISCIQDKEVILGEVENRINGRKTNTLKIPARQMDQLVALSKFLRKNSNVTQEDLNYLLKTKWIKFKFLRKINNMMPDLLDEIKNHGPQHVAIYYANRVQVNEQIEKALP